MSEYAGKSLKELKELLKKVEKDYDNKMKVYNDKYNEANKAGLKLRQIKNAIFNIELGKIVGHYFKYESKNSDFNEVSVVHVQGKVDGQDEYYKVDSITINQYNDETTLDIGTGEERHMSIFDDYKKATKEDWDEQLAKLTALLKKE